MRKVSVPVLFAIVVCLLAVAAPAFAQGGGTMSTRLRGFEEVPSIASPGGGRFEATVGEDGESVAYELSYSHLEGQVTQAHIHIAQRGVNGGIMVFLCSNLGNGPAGTPACPAGGGTVTGTFDASDIIGPASQGVAPGELFTLLRAIRAGFAYANVHTNLFPSGEIRGQVVFRSGDSGSESAVEPE